MSTIQFRTLGTLDLRAADGRELHSLLAQPKRIALLAYLCIAQPRGYHRRDTLLGLFWPDSDQEHARTSLRKSLHILRRALGEDAVLSRGDEEVGVDFQRVSCDVASFEDLIAGNRFQDALKLYGGDLLPGFFVDDAAEFEQWLNAERSRLRAAAGRAAYTAAEQLEKTRDYAGAVSLARRSLELADIDERTMRKLITLQFKAGDRASAIETYEAFARRLAAEYQTEPSAQTRSLIEQIRVGAEATAPKTDINLIDAGAATPTVSERARRRTPLLYAAATVAILIFIPAIWGWVRPTPSKAVVRYTLAIDSIEALTTSTPGSGRIAISPDGSRLAYVGGPGAQLIVRMLNELHATTIPGTENASTPFFSPDGRNVGILRERSIQIAPVDGGPLVTIPSSLTGLAGASWGADGYIYADGFLAKPLVRVRAQQGAVAEWFTVLDTADGESDHSWPVALPNGKGVLFTVTRSGRNARIGQAAFAIAVADTRTGKHHVILDGAAYPRYATGRLLYQNGRTLMMVHFDENSMSVTGTPISLLGGKSLGGPSGVTDVAADVAVSANGTLVYAVGAEKLRFFDPLLGVVVPDEELVWRTRDGSSVPVDPDWHGFFSDPSLSPDGKRLAISKSVDGRSGDIWIKQLDRGPPVQLTHEGVYNRSPTWMPDGRSVTFSGNIAGGKFRLLTKRAGGSGETALQFSETRDLSNPQWSPDGRWLIFEASGAGSRGADIVGLRPGIDSAAVTVVGSKFDDFSGVLSPNGHWLAYSSLESGTPLQIYVVPFPNSGAAKWVTASLAINPMWSHNGNELFYRGAAGDIFAVNVKTSPSFSFGKPKRLFAAPWDQFGPTGYAVSQDDQRFLMIKKLNSIPDKLIVVENWFEELKAKAN
jgi:DNA-binding SARP family transcriptional activator